MNAEKEKKKQKRTTLFASTDNTSLCIVEDARRTQYIIIIIIKFLSMRLSSKIQSQLQAHYSMDKSTHITQFRTIKELSLDTDTSYRPRSAGQSLCPPLDSRTTTGRHFLYLLR